MWGWAIAFFGVFGGLLGYLVLRPQNPRRASHVLKWGFITGLGSILLWFALLAVLVASLSVSHGGGTGSATGGQSAGSATPSSQPSVTGGQPSQQQPAALTGFRVNVSSGPGSGSPYSSVGEVSAGDNVSVVCSTQGESVDGNSKWDQVKFNGNTGYVPDEWVNNNQGTDLPSC
jgi:hypothetical protein